MIVLTFSLDARYNAGVFPYAKHNGKIWFLLGEEIRWKAYNDFGGKEDRADKDNTRMTAAREFVEETNYIYGQKEVIYPKIDEQFGFGDRNKYRTYLLEVPYKSIRDIKNQPKHSDSDKSDYTWVLAEDLLSNVANSTDDKNVYVDDFQGKTIKIFHRFVWILRNYNNEIRNIIRPLSQLQTTQPSAIQPQAWVELQGRKYAVDSVSVLPFAFAQDKAVLLLGSDVLGSSYQLMYFDFVSSVDYNAFVKGVFNPLLSAAYGFQKVRDLFGDDNISFIQNAITRSNKMSFYDAAEKNLMFLAEIEYKNFDSANYPCRWVDAQDFLLWVKKTNVSFNELNIPVHYRTIAIYQPFVARIKKFVDDIEKIIKVDKNKYVASQQVGKQDGILKASLVELHVKLNKLQDVL